MGVETASLASIHSFKRIGNIRDKGGESRFNVPGVECTLKDSANKVQNMGWLKRPVPVFCGHEHMG